MPPVCVKISVSRCFQIPPLLPLKWTLVGAEQREMVCYGVPSILGLGSYLEFRQIFSGKHFGLGGKGPGFSTNSLPWLCIPHVTNWLRDPSVPFLPSWLL